MKYPECNEDDCKTCMNKCYMNVNMPYRYVKKCIVDEHGLRVEEVVV